jgi:hypothetical protein
MEPSRPFDRTKDCVSCLREIDEITVKLKKLTLGGDTYRQYDPKYLNQLKYEKLCTDCFYGKATKKVEEKNDLL